MATKTLTKQCTSHESRKQAIELCHFILDSDGHTQCVVKYACNPMNAFAVSSFGREEQGDGSPRQGGVEGSSNKGRGCEGGVLTGME